MRQEAPPGNPSHGGPELSAALASGSVPQKERPLGEGPSQYHMTYMALLDYNQKLGLEARVKRSWAEVPPLLSRV